MIEVVIKNYIEKAINKSVFFEYPEKVLPEFIVIERIGSKSYNNLNMGSFTFQCYSNTLYKTAQLNQKMLEVVKRLVELKEISSVKIDTYYNYTDTEKKKYRYQAVVDIWYYEGGNL